MVQLDPNQMFEQAKQIMLQAHPNLAFDPAKELKETIKREDADLEARLRADGMPGLDNQESPIVIEEEAGIPVKPEVKPEVKSSPKAEKMEEVTNLQEVKQDSMDQISEAIKRKASAKEEEPQKTKKSKPTPEVAIAQSMPRPIKPSPEVAIAQSTPRPLVASIGNMKASKSEIKNEKPPISASSAPELKQANSPDSLSGKNTMYRQNIAERQNVRFATQAGPDDMIEAEIELKALEGFHDVLKGLGITLDDKVLQKIFIDKKEQVVQSLRQALYRNSNQAPSVITAINQVSSDLTARLTQAKMETQPVIKKIIDEHFNTSAQQYLIDRLENGPITSVIDLLD